MAAVVGSLSLAASLAALPAPQRAAMLAELSPTELTALESDWRFWARPEQLAPPGDWSIWLVLAGRGFGKTRTGAEFVREEVTAGRAGRVALVGPTAADARDVIVEGESGILATSPTWDRPVYEPSKRRLTWANGAIATLYSADEPERLRGPQHDCFVAGTMVRTIAGDVPIERVRIGDLVITRAGARRVANARHTEKLVGRVEFSDGSSLIGTAQHRILTPRGWTSLSDLNSGDTVCSGDALQTATSRRTLEAGRSISTGGSGSSITAPSPMVIRSTTRTRTPRTTASGISNCSQFGSIARSMPMPRRTLTSAASIAAVPPFAASDPLAPSFAAHASTAAPNARGAQSEPADTAGGSLFPVAGLSVVSVVSTWAPVGREIAYDLTVDGQPEFIANGIVAHNCVWGDEIAAWRYPEAYDQLMFGLRLGAKPRAIFTTTPKPVKLVTDLLKDPSCVVTRGSTYANRANLAPAFFRQIIRKYEGTRLGRQELNAEVLEDVEGALWTLGMIEAARLTLADLALVKIGRTVVAIDPNVTKDEGADEAGVVAVMRGVGRCPCGKERCGYVLRDASGEIGPMEWATRAVGLYHDLTADRIVAEVNNGGDLVENQIRVVDKRVAYKAVRAAKAKRTRAEPVAALYEQGRVHHVGSFPQLEDQLTRWVPDIGLPSPGRLDALVWGVTELMVEPQFPALVGRA